MRAGDNSERVTHKWQHLAKHSIDMQTRQLEFGPPRRPEALEVVVLGLEVAVLEPEFVGPVLAAVLVLGLV